MIFDCFVTMLHVGFDGNDTKHDVDLSVTYELFCKINVSTQTMLKYEFFYIELSLNI